jgi:hypothetical protein
VKPSILNPPPTYHPPFPSEIILIMVPSITGKLKSG